jgi:Patatin
LTIPKSKDEQKEEENRMDPELIRELDASVSILTGSGSEIGRREILKDIEMLRDVTSTSSSSSMRQRRGGEVQDVDNEVTNLLPLSDPRHTARIEIDMRRLAVNIASNIESIDQWKSFCEDGGGILPLLECIRDGAREVRQGQLLTQGNDYDSQGMLGLVEQREAAFEAACKACKALRDLCVISKPFSAVITDSILRADVMWAIGVDVESKTEKKQLFKGGILFDLAFLIKYSMDSDKLYNPRSERDGMPSLRSNGINIISNRKQRKLARQRCALYVIQLLLAMSFASDKAVDRLRATMGLTDTVLACSSYAKKERLIRRWIRYPIELIKRKVRSEESNEEISEDPFLTAASVATGISGQIKGTSNQLLAALGYNVWYPKTAGQKGLRILCLDGGGTRGITAISSMRSIVEAIGGVEVCDTFDMIAGTSTGAIIAFLVGLRRESSTMARKRYDKLIKRIFIKSALSTPMLLFTTATYDESPFNKVMMSILNDNSMLASRADPRVPLVFAISSKMSSTPTQLCLFRNYNYNGGEMNDAFVEDPIEAKEELSLPLDDDIFQLSGKTCYDDGLKSQANRPTQGSRHPGSFRVLQRAALRATTAAPTVFKPVLMGGELYCDGGIVASNPTAVAIHEARTIFPNVPIELVVSCGTGAFVEEKSEPRIGWVSGIAM